MHLLYVIHYPVFGGEHNAARILAPALLDHGSRLTVAVPQEPGNAARLLADSGVDVASLPLARMRAVADPRAHLRFATSTIIDTNRLARLIHDRCVDMVMVGGLINPQAGFAALWKDIPLIWRVVDTRPPALLRTTTFGIARRFADTLMFNGRALRDLHFRGANPAVPSVVFTAPVDTHRFVPPTDGERREARRRLGLAANSPVVATVANINPQKGIEYFLRAAGLVHRHRPDCQFVVCGYRHSTHADYWAFLVKEARRTAIPATHLRFLDGDPLDVYHAADLKLITSTPRSEGTTTTGPEALACGVPVVATNVGALAETIRDGIGGRLVRPLDSRALADAVIELMANPNHRKALGAQGRAIAVREYDVRHFLARHFEAFRSARIRHAERRSFGKRHAPRI